MTIVDKSTWLNMSKRRHKLGPAGQDTGMSLRISAVMQKSENLVISVVLLANYVTLENCLIILNRRVAIFNRGFRMRIS